MLLLDVCAAANIIAHNLHTFIYFSIDSDANPSSVLIDHWIIAKETVAMLRKLLLASFCFALAFTSPTKMAQAGVGHGGGGDEIGLDFQSSIATAMENLKVRDAQLYQQVQGLDVEQILARARFVVVDEALEVKYQDIIQNSTATNDPETGLILINRKRWLAINDDHLKEGIALHEILSLKGIESTGYYPISSKYVSLMGVNQGELQDHTKAKQVSLEIKVENLIVKSEQKMDILFVIDNSGTMQNSQNSLTIATDAFIKQLRNSSIDFHVAVTTTDAWRSAFQSNTTNSDLLRRVRPGEINLGTNPLSYKTNSGVFVVTPKTNQLEQALRINLNQGISGSGDERAFESFQRTLEFEGNSDFRRKDAFLSVVILSDEDDFSTNTSNYMPTLYDEETNSDPVILAPSSNPHSLYALYRDPLLTPVSQFRSFLEKIAGAVNYSVSSIAVLDPQCKTELNSQMPGRRIGRRYLELTDATQGYKGSICTVQESLAGYADYLARTPAATPTTYEIKLDKKPLIETVVVKINGRLIPHEKENGWSFDETTSMLILSGNSVPQKNDIVSINYDFVN
jgi:hypothetical protein